MFGMIKNSLFGNTEKTEYKLLSSETKVRDVGPELPVTSDSSGVRLRALWQKVLQRVETRV